MLKMKNRFLHLFYSFMLFYSFTGDEALPEADLAPLFTLVTTAPTGKPQHGEEIPV